MPSTREIIEAAITQKLVGQRGKPIQVRFLPGLKKEELDSLARSLPAPPPDDVLDLLEFCSGLEGMLDQIDFTGRSLENGFGLDSLIPHALPIAHDGCGNYWVFDLQPESATWGPIYFCCHDAPIMLLQATTLQQFMTELFKKYVPPHKTAIDDVHDDRVFGVWRNNPSVIAHADALASPDSDIRTFASELESDFELIDLRDAQIGMGFSWGRYGPRTEVQRFGVEPIFAYRRPKKTSLFSRLFGR